MASLLVDEGIGRDLVQTLVAEGCAAHHWLEFGPKGAHDSSVFAEAQQRGLTIFTHNRDDYLLLATTWRNWGHGDHFGVITGRKGRQQPAPGQLLALLRRYCAESASFVNRVEFF